MQIRNVIILLLFLGTGCSVVRRIPEEKDVKEGSEEDIVVMDEVISQNITGSNYYIQRADIEIISEDGQERIVGTVKYRKPDEYLVSLRGRSGIEIARIYISGDTLLVNERMKRKLYAGSTEYLEEKYGVKLDFLPLITGDLVIDNDEEWNREKCIEGIKRVNTEKDGYRMIIEVDCEKGKMVMVRGWKDQQSRGVEIIYDNFIQLEGILIPGTIEITDTEKETNIKIDIKKIELNWEGEIEFIPGKRYEVIELV